MFYQLKSFDQSLSDSVIAAQAGVMASSFTGAQFLTAMIWGRISDSEKGGRKMVIMIGLLGASKWEYTDIGISAKQSSVFLYRFRFFEDILASYNIQDHGWGIKWECWCFEDHGIRDCTREEVRCSYQCS